MDFDYFYGRDSEGFRFIHLPIILIEEESITGTQVDKRFNFQRLIHDCINGDIDMRITKPISIFARNILDCLNYVRELE